MYVCTFFGDVDYPDSIEPILRERITRLITHEDVSCFYVGDEGRFNNTVIKLLKELQNYLYDIDVYVILDHFPRDDAEIQDPYKIFPFVFDEKPRRYTKHHRDNYMLKNSEYVIAYLTNDIGGEAEYVKKALKSKKKVINIADFIKE